MEARIGSQESAPGRLRLGRWMRASAMIVVFSALLLGAAGCSGSFCYGTGCDSGSITFGQGAKNYSVQNQSSTFSLGGKMSWVAKLSDTVRTTAVTVQILNSGGSKVLGSIPLTDILSSDKNINQFEVNQAPVRNVVIKVFHLPGPGTYLMRCVDKSGKKLAEGTFTIKA